MADERAETTTESLIKRFKERGDLQERTQHHAVTVLVGAPLLLLVRGVGPFKPILLSDLPTAVASVVIGVTVAISAILSLSCYYLYRSHDAVEEVYADIEG